jgi:hypothetical protein
MYNKKILTCGVIFLFVVLSLNSTAYSERNLFEKEDLFDIEISEYRSDGTVNNRIVKLNRVELNELKSDLLYSSTNEKKFEILKEKGLISQNIKLNNLEEEMYLMANQMGISKDSFPDDFKIRLPIILTLFSVVNAVYFGGVSLSIGVSPLIRIFNIISPIKLPGIDVLNFVGGLFGVTHTVGLFNKQSLITFPGFSSMIGFIGFSFKIPAAMHIFVGFSVATVGFGLGFNLKEWIF